MQADICRAWEREAHKELTRPTKSAKDASRSALASKRASPRTVSLVSEPSAPAALVRAGSSSTAKLMMYCFSGPRALMPTGAYRHLRVMCAQIFELGFFNADPHPGNVALRFDERLRHARRCSYLTGKPTTASRLQN